MQFKNGTHVFTADGEDIGEINRVVINPQSKEVTHLVVRQGLLFTEDKVVPVDLVKIATDDRVIITETADNLPDFPPFEETYYRSFDDPGQPNSTVYARPYVGYPPLGTAWWGYPGYMGYGAFSPAMDPGVTQVEQNIPQNTVGLKEGASVISADDEQVGEVSRVYVDDRSNRATHIVVSRGLLTKEKKLVPTSWVSKINEREIRLGVDKDQLDRLGRFED